QVLPFVFMQPLHLHVEQRIGRDLDAGARADQAGERRLVVAFDRAPRATKVRIIGEGFELAQLVQVLDPTIADAASDQVGKLWVAQEKKASRRDAVGLVAELLWGKLIEIAQSPRFEQ